MELTPEFIGKAMSLSDKDRAELAHRLLLSLEDEIDDATQEEIDIAWAEEIERRLRLIDEDPSRLHDGETVLDEIRESLRVRRESKKQE